MALNEFDKMNALGQVLDTTWGDSSTNGSDRVTCSVKHKFIGHDNVLLTYNTIVTFNGPMSQHVLMQRFEEEAKTILAQFVKNAKEEYKTLTKESVSFTKVKENEPEVESIGYSLYNPKKTAYFRKQILYKVD